MVPTAPVAKSPIVLRNVLDIVIILAWIAPLGNVISDRAGRADHAMTPTFLSSVNCSVESMVRFWSVNVPPMVLMVVDEKLVNPPHW